MEYVTLNNGVKNGTYQKPASITEECVAKALSAGLLLGRC